MQCGKLAMPVLAASLLAGCQMKSVNISTAPAGAQLKIYQVDGSERELVKTGTSPMSTQLGFGKEGRKYVVETSMYKYRPTSFDIVMEPKGTPKKEDYSQKLVQFLDTLPTTVFEPRLVEQQLQMSWRTEVTEGMLDTREQPTKGEQLHIEKIAELPQPEQSGDFGGLAVSPSEDVVVYHQVVREVPGKVYTVKKEERTLQAVLDAHPEFDRATILRLNKLPQGELNPGMPLRVEDDRIFTRIVLRPTSGRGISTLARSNEEDNPALYLYPSFTAEGQYVVFASNRNSVDPRLLNLWRAPLGSSAITKVTDPIYKEYEGSVGPEGHIAFTSLRPNRQVPEIGTVRLDGTQPTELLSGEEPQVSPDGRQILYVARDRRRMDGRHQLWIMSWDGNNQTKLSDDNTAFDIKQPRWSPDGRYIVFASNEGKDGDPDHGKPNWDIWLMPANDLSKNVFARRVRLTYNGSVDDCPGWDRGSQAVYFRSNRGGKGWNIWRVDFSPEAALGTKLAKP